MNGLDVGLLMGVTGFAASIVSWFRTQTRTAYARERELTHILNSSQQLSLSIESCFKEIQSDHDKLLSQLDEVSDRMSRLEILIVGGDRQHGKH